MKLLFDQNLSRKLSLRLSDLFPGSTHVIEIGLEHRPDAEIWLYAKQGAFVLVTADTDFGAFVREKGFPPKVVLLANCNYPTRIAAELLRTNAIRLRDFETGNTGLLVLRPR